MTGAAIGTRGEPFRCLGTTGGQCTAEFRLEDRSVAPLPRRMSSHQRMLALSPFSCPSLGITCNPSRVSRFVTWITRTPIMTREWGEVVVADAPLDTQYAISVYWAVSLPPMHPPRLTLPDSSTTPLPRGLLSFSLLSSLLVYPVTPSCARHVILATRAEADRRACWIPSSVHHHGHRRLWRHQAVFHARSHHGACTGLTLLACVP